MKVNKLYFYRLLINAGLFLLPLGIWYLCEQLNYGPLLKIMPKITWLAIIMAVPVLICVLRNKWAVILKIVGTFKVRQV